MKLKAQKVIFLFLIAFYGFSLFPLTSLLAQPLVLPPDSDLFAPSIRHTVSETSIKPKIALKLEAVVTDNDTVQEVILFYRSASKEVYDKIQMKSDGEKNYFARVPGKKILRPAFEYYIQASDRAGNLSLRGLPFSPLKIVVSSSTEKKKPPVLLPPPPPKKEQQLPLPRSKPIPSRKKHRLPPPSF